MLSIRYLLIVIVSFLLYTGLIIPSWAGQPPAPVAQTGQTDCWDTAGAVISCIGTGQDGEIRAGVAWPQTRFTDNNNGTITDNLTGLVWLKNMSCQNITWPTFEGSLNRIKTLSSGSCGLTDGSTPGEWRLPNARELASLSNSQAASGADWLTTQGFSNAVYGYFKSSTKVSNNEVGIDLPLKMSYTSGGGLMIPPVRDGSTAVPPPAPVAKSGQSSSYAAGDDGNLKKGVAWPIPRFTDNKDSTMMDNLTGLIWTTDSASSGTNNCGAATPRSWQGALTYIACLNTNNHLGYNDWRLPNSGELFSLFNFGLFNNASWLTTQGFTDVSSDGYWTSSTYPNGPSTALVGHLGTLNLTPSFKTSLYRILPVRSGFVANRIQQLTLSFDGTGGGSISGDISCSSGSTCSPVVFPQGTVVTLIPTPNATSVFGGWGGACTSGTGNCSLYMDSAKTVSATFTAAPKAKVGTKDFPTLQMAYDDAGTTTGSVIKLLEGNLAETFVTGKDINVKLEGGYNAAYDAISSRTAIQSPLTVNNGTVRVKDINIK